MLAPFVDDGSGLLEAQESALFQAVASESAVKALVEIILHRFSRLDEVELYTCPLRPQEHGLDGEFRAVVQNNLLWQAMLIVQYNPKTRQALARD